VANTEIPYKNIDGSSINTANLTVSTTESDHFFEINRMFSGCIEPISYEMDIFRICSVICNITRPDSLCLSTKHQSAATLTADGHFPARKMSYQPPRMGHPPAGLRQSRLPESGLRHTVPPFSQHFFFNKKKHITGLVSIKKNSENPPTTRP